MSASLVRALAAALAVLMLVPWTARAEDGPYSNFLVGERSMGLGGAFVAVADDTSALFHNPSGLASLGTGSYSGGLWSFVRGTRSIENGYRSDLGSVELEHSAALALPSFLGGVVKIGKRRADRVRPHALGLALLQPYAAQYRFVAQLDEAGAVDRFEVRQEDRSRWLGVSYAYRLRPGLAFGVTLFGANRSVSHDEVELRVRDGSTTTAGAVHFSRASTLSVSSYQAIARFGMHVDLARALRMGVMFQPPGIDIGGSANAEHVDATSDAGGTQLDVMRADDLVYHLPTPWELRLGLGYLPSSSDLISVDVSIFGPAGSASDPMPLVENDNPQFGLFVPRVGYRRPSLRGALGFEVDLIPEVPIRGGVFFERSSAPEVLSTSDVYVRDRIDNVGTSFSVGLRTSGYDLAIGATAVLGQGEGLALIRSSDPSAAPRYRAADVQDMMFMVFIGGGKSAVRQLVKSVFE